MRTVNIPRKLCLVAPRVPNRLYGCSDESAALNASLRASGRKARREKVAVNHGLVSHMIVRRFDPLLMNAAAGTPAHISRAEEVFRHD